MSGSQIQRPWWRVRFPPTRRHQMKGERDSVRARTVRGLNNAPTSPESEWLALIYVLPVALLLAIFLLSSWLVIPTVLAVGYVIWRNRDKPRRRRRRSEALRRRADRARR